MFLHFGLNVISVTVDIVLLVKTSTVSLNQIFMFIFFNQILMYVYLVQSDIYVFLSCCKK